ncbi:MAG: lysophospholipid acyltransferase family protein [Nitrospirota bacterium]
MKFFLYRFLKITLSIFLKVFYRFEVFGSENVPDRGGAIVAANHASYLDPPVIAAALKRCPTYIAKEGLFKVPLLGPFIRLFSFPVKRGKTLPSTIKEAVSRLKEGEIIVIFPEGGRSADGNILEAKRGVGMIAALSRIPVIPVLIEGTDKALPMGVKLLRPAKIKVIFGNPIIIEKEKDRDFQERFSKNVMEAIKDLKAKA